MEIIKRRKEVNEKFKAKTPRIGLKSNLYSNLHEFKLNNTLNYQNQFYTKGKKYIDNLQGHRKYIVSGNYQVAYNSKQNSNTIITAKVQKRKFDFYFQAKDNLTDDEMRNLIYYKLSNIIKHPMFGRSNNRLLGIEGYIYSIPQNYNMRRQRLYDTNYVKLKILEKFSNNITIKNNCFLDYFYDELSRHYKKPIKYDYLKKILDEITGDIVKNGINIDEFVKFMDTYYDNINYYLLSVDYKKFITKSNNTRSPFNIVFYINNDHIYPITNKEIQNFITHNTSQPFKLFSNNNVYDDDKILMNEKTELKDGFQYILQEDKNYSKYRDNLIDESNYGIEYYTDNCFKHPTIDCLIYKNDEYESRKNTFEKLNLNIKFNNQSYASISLLLINSIKSLIPSYYNPQSFYYLSNYEPKPMIDNIKTISHTQSLNVKAVDISKHYSSIYYKNFQDKNFYIPIYDYHHIVEPYYNNEKILLGEYYIKKVEYKKLFFGGYFIHSFVIKRLLKRKIIKKSDILYKITTKKHYKPDNFKKFIDITSQFDNDIFKKLNNMLNGVLNNKYNKKSKENFYSNSIENFTYLINSSLDNNYEIKTEISNNNFYLQRYKKQNNYENTSSFYRATLSLSILEVINLIDKIKGDIIAVKTDCVYYNGDDFDYDDITNDKIKDLGIYRKECSRVEFFEDRYEPIIFKEYEHKYNNQKLFLGCGGSGKSYETIKNANKNTLFLSPTHSSNENLISKSKELNKNNLTFKTIQSFFEQTKNNYKSSVKQLLKYDHIVVDEIFMVDTKYLRFLINHHNIILLGDDKQLRQIENYKNENHNLLISYIGRYFNIEYKEFNKNSRYDLETYNIINKFVETKNLNSLNELSTYDENRIYPFYICSYNETRKLYTKKCCDYHYENEYKFKYNNNIEKYKIGINMPIICTTNFLKKLNIYNNYTGYILDINENEIKINIHSNIHILNINTFLNNFLPFYVSTIHKIQGQKISTDYAILDIYNKSSFITFETIYTAITRTTNYKNIHIKKNIDITYDKYDYHNDYISTEYKQKNTTIYKYKKDNKIIYTTKKPKEKNEIIYKGNIDKYQQQNIIYEDKKKNKKTFLDMSKFNLECNTQYKVENKSKVFITDDYIRFYYYDENNKQKKKEIKTKKDLNKSIKKINELSFFKPTEIINSSKLNFELNNNKLVLCGV